MVHKISLRQPKGRILLILGLLSVFYDEEPGHAAVAPPQSVAAVEAAPGGVVVEEVGKGSALERAGVEPGDLLLSWERLANPPANPESAAGTFESPFDWLWLKVKQAPRGTVQLVGQREGEARMFEVTPGLWEGKVRPRMAGAILEAYLQGKERLESEDLEGAMRRWAEVAESETMRGWMLFRMGETWAEAREWEKAQAFFRSALEEAEESRARVAVWRAVGMAYEKQSEFDKATEAYETAQEIGERAWGEKSLGVAYSLNSLGNVAYDRGDLDRAADYLTQALEIQQKLGPGSLDVAGSLLSLGNVTVRRGDLDRAAKYYTQALEIKQKLAPLDVAGSLNNLGMVAVNRGDPDRAAEYFTQALEIWQKLAPGSLDVATSLNNLGIVAWERGDLDRAAEYFTQALEIKQKLAPGSLDVANSLSGLGMVDVNRGDLDRAAEYFTQALEIWQKLAPGSLDVANGLSTLGVVAWGRGDLDRAVAYYTQALVIRRKLAPGSLDVSGSLNNLGLVALARGDLDRAAAYVTQALEIEQKLAPGGTFLAGSLSSLGKISKDRGDLDRAADYFTHALEILQKLAPSSIAAAEVLHDLGLVAWARGDLDRAAEYLTQALEIQQKLSPKSSAEAETLYELGRVSRKKNKLQVATSLFQRALASLEGQVGKLGGSHDTKAGFRARRRSYYQDQIEVQLELNQAAQAFHTLERSRARGFLEQLAERNTVFTGAIPAALEQERRRLAVRFDRTQQDLAQLDSRDHASEIEDLHDEFRRLRDEARDIEEKIRRASPRVAALQYPQPLDLEAARAALDPGTLMLSYSVGGKSAELFAVSRGKPLRVETVSIGEKTLRRQVEGFRELIEEVRIPGSPRSMILDTYARSLYTTLIEPVADLVAASDRLLILADGPLHTLPWGALRRDTAAGEAQYLAAWKPLHSALSATVYAELRKLRRADERSFASARVAAFGDPRYPGSVEQAASHGDVVVRSVTERGFFDWQPLPATRREVEGIAGVFPQGSVSAYLGAEATEERAKTLTSDVSVVHFATHAHVDERFPLNSFLALTIPEEYRKGRDNGLLQAWEIFERVRLDADLVVLSACRSGVGAEQGGEGLIGLTRAFQYAGARSVLATLWNVGDVTTAELMVRFYRHLLSGQAKDEALRGAQLELLRGPIELHGENGEVRRVDASAPYFWAAFQVYGDWR